MYRNAPATTVLLVTTVVLLPSSVLAQATTPAIPGRILSFPAPLPPLSAFNQNTYKAALPDKILISAGVGPATTAGKNKRVWTLEPLLTPNWSEFEQPDPTTPDAASDPKAKPRPKARRPDLFVGYSVPQLPKGLYTVWYDAPKNNPALSGQSMVVNITPTFALAAGSALYGIPGDLPVTIRFTGPAQPPPLLQGSPPTKLPTVKVKLQIVDGDQIVMLAPAQDPVTTTNASGIAQWKVRIIGVGHARLSATATGYPPLPISLVGLKPGELDRSVDFTFKGKAIANIQGIPPSLITNDFTIHSFFSRDRRSFAITSFPQLGPRLLFGGLDLSYTITKVDGGNGVCVPDAGLMHVPLTLRYGPNFAFSPATLSDPSDVSIVLTTGQVVSPQNIFKLQGSPLANGQMVLVGAGIFRGGLFEGRDYQIRIACSFAPADQLNRPK